MEKRGLSASNGRSTPAKPVVCVVDDDQAVRLAVSTLLRSRGFEVHAYAGGPEFMLSGTAEHAQCLIADIRMKGMSGFELQEAVKAAALPLPIVFISGHADDDARARALEAGAIALLNKPFSESALLGAVRVALRTAPGAEG